MSYLDEPIRVTPCEWHEQYAEDDCYECMVVEEAWIESQVDQLIEARRG